MYYSVSLCSQKYTALYVYISTYSHIYSVYIHNMCIHVYTKVCMYRYVCTYMHIYTYVYILQIRIIFIFTDIFVLLQILIFEFFFILLLFIVVIAFSSYDLCFCSCLSSLYISLVTRIFFHTSSYLFNFISSSTHVSIDTSVRFLYIFPLSRI